jgi:hypothetical protein
MSRYITYTIGLLMAVVTQLSWAQELFPKEVARTFEPAQLLESDATIGGYAIYQGDIPWHVLDLKTNENNVGTKFGKARLVAVIGNDFLGEAYLSANINNRSSTRGYYSADLCSAATKHLVVIDKVRGELDNCMTIDALHANVGGRDMVLLFTHIRNTQSNNRLYDVSIYLNVAHLGFPNSSIADWTSENIANDTKKSQLLEKVTNWAKQLQDGINAAVAFGKSQDAFASVPPISSLMVSNAALYKEAFEAYISQKKRPKAGVSYVFCESSKTMVAEGSSDCQ